MTESRERAPKCPNCADGRMTVHGDGALWCDRCEVKVSYGDAFVPLKTEVTDWLRAAPPAVKRVFFESITFLNFWREQRNTNFQAIGAYDGSMLEPCKALFREAYEVCDAIVEASKEVAGNQRHEP